MKTKKTDSRSAFFNLRSIAALSLGLCSLAFAISAVKMKGPVAAGESFAQAEERMRDIPTLGENGGDENKNLGRLEQFWNDRLTYPTGKFNPAWLRAAAAQHTRMQSALPAGNFNRLLNPPQIKGLKASQQPRPLSLSTSGFTALGPAPERMTGCTGCFDYSTTQGRVNAIVVDPTTTTNGSIVAYLGAVGGGVWKTTNCCSVSTTWTVTTDDPLISTTSIDTLVIDPNNHNTIYAGTGDLNYGSFSMGSQGILKSTDAGGHWVVIGSTVFSPAYTEPAGQFPQYDSVGKVRVDPNNSNNIVAGTKKGLFFSYDGGNNWTGPCTTNSFNTMRQDITGLELSDMGGGVTRIVAAVGVRGFASTVQYDLGNNGANGIYAGNMVASGCPTFSSIATDSNGFVFGTQVTGSPYGTGGLLHAGSGTAYVSTSTTTNVGDQLGRIDIAVAPSNPNVIYAQVQSIAPNSNSGGNASCGSANGCQLGAFYTTNGGTSWTFMTGSAGGSLRVCASSGGGVGSGAGDYPQNWYDQAIAVDPNDATKAFFDTYVAYYATQGGSSFYDTTCGYSQTALGMHSDQHVLTYVPGNSNILIAAGDGGPDATINAAAVSPGVTRPTWFHMVGGLNTIEFYNGDISGNFANDPSPSAVGGAQDNGPSSATFSGSPTGPVQWQMGLGGDGFSGHIDPVGIGVSAVGTITVSALGISGQTFTIGTQTFTWAATRTVAGTVAIGTTASTAATNIRTAVNADIPSQVLAGGSGTSVTITAAQAGTAGNSIPFANGNSTNLTFNGSGTLGATTAGTNATVLRYWEGNNSGG